MQHLSEDDLVRRIAALELALVHARNEIATVRREMRRWRSTRVSARVITAIAFAALALNAYPIRTRAQGGGQTVTAPFVVVGASGHKIMEVKEAGQGGQTQNQLRIYNGTGMPVAFVMSTDWGMGTVAVTDGSGYSEGSMKAMIGVSGDHTGAFAVRDAGGKLMADIVEGDNGGRGMFIYDKSEKPVVRLLAKGGGGGQVTAGEAKKQSGIIADDQAATLLLSDPGGRLVMEATSASPGGQRGLWVMNEKETPIVAARTDLDGSGFLAVGQPDGSTAASMEYQNGGVVSAYRPGGSVTAALRGSEGILVYGATGAAVASLKENPDRGTGELNIGNRNGDDTIKAGTLPDGRGMVEVFPQGGPQPIPTPTQLRGWSGGSH